MHAIIGLGNPGARYAGTRHNIGFALVEALALQQSVSWRADRTLKAEVADVRWGGSAVWLIKPQTFMNLSGESVVAAMAQWKLEPDRLMVVHDELDLPLARLRLKLGGGHGGHNGLRSITQHIGEAYARLRMGIGRPADPRFDVSSYVLARFDEAAKPWLQQALPVATAALMHWVKDGFSAAQQALHAGKLGNAEGAVEASPASN